MCSYITWLDAGKGIDNYQRLGKNSVCVERGGMDGSGKNKGAGLGRVMPEAGEWVKA